MTEKSADFLEFSPSVSSSQVSFADFKFSIIRFLMCGSPTRTPGTKVHIDNLVDCPRPSRSSLDSGTHNGLSEAIQLDSVLS